MRVIFLASLTSGCTVLFPLEEPPPGDTGPALCTTGHDEDGDGISDLCDNCLGIPNKDQLDTTEDVAPGGMADGIGDACDPNPNSSDRVALAIAFAGDGENDQWLAASVQTGWRFDGENAVFEGTTPGLQAVVRSTREQPSRPFAIEFQISVNAPYDDGYIGVRADARFDGAGEEDPPRFGVECGVGHHLSIVDGTTPVAFSSAAHRNVMPPATEGGLIVELPRSTRYHVLMRYDVPAGSAGDGTLDLRCIVQSELGGAPAQTQINFVSPGPTGTELALAAVTAAAQIDYLVIYRPQ